MANTLQKLIASVAAVMALSLPSNAQTNTEKLSDNGLYRQARIEERLHPSEWTRLNTGAYQNYGPGVPKDQLWGRYVDAYTIKSEKTFRADIQRAKRLGEMLGISVEERIRDALDYASIRSFGNEAVKVLRSTYGKDKVDDQIARHFYSDTIPPKDPHGP